MSSENGITEPTSHAASAPAPGPRQALRRRDRILLLAISLAVLLPGFHVALFDRDEGWYAQVSREMLESGDWLIPRYLGEPWIAKPPLLYWLVATSFRLFGMGEWQARLVPVLASVVSILLVGSIGAMLYGRKTGVLSGVLFTTMFLPAIVGKMLLTDSLLLACTLAAVLSALRLAMDRITHLWCAIWWAAIGAGILTKGPAVLVFAGSLLLGLMTVPTWRRWIRDWRWWAWLPLAVVIAAPWYILVSRRAGETFVDQFLWFEIGSRIAGTPHGHGGPPGYYLLLSLAGLLPWTIFVPGAIVVAWMRRRSEPSARVLLIWLAVPWVILEIIASKLPHYILPCYVPIAVLLGRELTDAIAAARPWSTLSKGEQRALGFWSLPLILVGAILIVLAPYVAMPSVGAAGVVLSCGFLFVRWKIKTSGIRPAFRTATSTIVLFHLTLGLWLLPSLDAGRLSRNLANCINAAAQPGDRVYVIGYAEPSLFFYVSNRGRPVDASAIPELVRSGEPAVIAMPEESLNQLDGATRGGLEHRGTAHGLNYVKMDWLKMTIQRTRRERDDRAPMDNDDSNLVRDGLLTAAPRR